MELGQTFKPSSAYSDSVNMAKKIGFVGTGKMAVAMIRGILKNGLYKESEIIASCKSDETLERVSKELGIEVTKDNAKVFEETDFIILAVKPNKIKEILTANSVANSTKKLLVSIAAGVKISTLEGYVPDSKIIRVMPNVCCTVLESASSYTLGTNATKEDGEKVKELLSAIGMAFEVAEKDIDAVTGLSGSSPAYMFMVIDALADGGVLMGLPRDVALRLAAQTMLGSAKTVLETGEHPDKLKDSVCSPGGTTIEGVKVLEERNMRAAFIAAVQASAEKSKAMGKN